MEKEDLEAGNKLQLMIEKIEEDIKQLQSYNVNGDNHAETTNLTLNLQILKTHKERLEKEFEILGKN